MRHRDVEFGRGYYGAKACGRVPSAAFRPAPAVTGRRAKENCQRPARFDRSNPCRSGSRVESLQPPGQQYRDLRTYLSSETLDRRGVGRGGRVLNHRQVALGAKTVRADRNIRFGKSGLTSLRHHDESIDDTNAGWQSPCISIAVLRRLIIGLLLLAGCSTVYADTTPVPETYTAYLYWSRNNFALVTYTDPNGFIDAPLNVPCSQLTEFRFTLGFRPVGCGAGVYFTPEADGLAVQIFSRREGLSGGFFVTPDQDGTFILRPGNRSYLIVSDPSAKPLSSPRSLTLAPLLSIVATPEPSAFMPTALFALLLFVLKMRR